MAGGLFGGGSGTELDPYIVEDAADLNAVRYFSSSFFEQTKDIDLTTYSNWRPIGDPYNDGSEDDFGGTYNGKRYLIKNINCSGDYYFAGLFGVAKNATLKNINLDNITISVEPSYSYGGACGSLVGMIWSPISGSMLSFISNCTVKNSSVTGRDYVGGLCGDAEYCTVEKSYVIDSSIANIQSGMVDVGALIGFAGYDAIISNCYCNGVLINITSLECYGLSCFVGRVYSGAKVNNCYAVGSISTPIGFDDSYTNAFIGYDYDESAEVSNCYYNGTINYSDNYAISKTTTEMMYQETFTDWNFNDIWRINEGESYPLLRLPIRLTVVISGTGITTPEVGAYLYQESEVVILSATAGEESRFVNWEGNVINTKSANTTITIGTADETVIAVFVPGGFNANLAGIITKDIKSLTFKRASHTDSKQSADAVNDNFRQVSTYTGTVTKTLKQYNQNLGTLNGNIEEIRQILIDAGIIV